MTSILDQMESGRHRYHECGGTILVGGSGEQQTQYCDRCGAYTHDLDGQLPTGTDVAANRKAFDAGEDSSPDA